MGFFSWLFCLILVVALVLLLFPFSVRIEFEAGERGARAFFFFFKKKIYEYEKKWGMESRKSEVGSRKDETGNDESGAELDERRETRDERLGTIDDSHVRRESGMTEDVEPRHPEPRSGEGSSAVPVESRVTKEPEKPEEKKDGVVTAESKAPSTTEKKTAPAKPAEEVAEKSETEKPKPEAKVKTKDEGRETSRAQDESIETEKSKPKKEKRKLSDREFWTIILTPDLDARAFRYALKILSAVLSLFRVRFIGCFVEGIQSDYMSMGYGAALNGFLKSFPYVGAWDFRMDWCHEKELRAAGSIRISVNLLRIFCFVLETLVLVGILAWIFWRRRAHVIKTNELPELGFIRRKILEFILED